MSTHPFCVYSISRWARSCSSEGRAGLRTTELAATQVAEEAATAYEQPWCSNGVDIRLERDRIGLHSVCLPAS